jgi:hypothetical protein
MKYSHNKIYSGGAAMNPKMAVAKAFVKNKGSTEGTIEDLLKVIQDGGIDMAIDFAKAGVAVANELVSTTIDTALGINVNKQTFEQLFQTSKEKLLKLAKVSMALLKDPQTQEAIQQIAQATLDMANQTLTEVKPYLHQLAEQLTQTMEQTGNVAVAGLAKTGISVAQAAVAEIPVVGGLIDLGVAAGKGFNAAAKTVETGMKNVDKMSTLMNDATSKAIPPVIKGVNEIKAAKEKLSSATSRVTQSVDSAQTTQAMKGGYNHKSLCLKHCSNKSMRRRKL